MFETGERFEAKDVWHGPMQSRDHFHWNEEILPVEGSDEPFCKYAVVAYNRETPYVAKRKKLPDWRARVAAFVRNAARICSSRINGSRPR